MNFKTRSSNITKVLYAILVLCVLSILFLSIYSIINNRSQNERSNLNNVLSNDLKNKDDSEDALMEFFKRTTTEAPTEKQTERPVQKPMNTEPPVQSDVNTETPEQINPPQPPVPAEKPDDTVFDNSDPLADAVEVLSLPAFFVRPVQGYICLGHDPELAQYSLAMNDYRTHTGLDISGDVGMNVKSIADGTISNIYDDPLMGMTVVIDHAGNLQSIYKNLQENLPSNIIVGANVRGGEVIGGVGETALIEQFDVPHLHFEMKKDGNYINPLEYIDE